MVNKRAEYIVEVPETCMGEVLHHLNELGAWFEKLEERSGTSRLRFRAPEAKMQGFDQWLRRAANKSACRFFQNLH
jgi:hypothetical protein